MAAGQAACPTGSLSVALRAECGTLSDAQLCADLYPPQGRPVEVAPWRVALVVVLQGYRRADRPPGGRRRPPLQGLAGCPEP